MNRHAGQDKVYWLTDFRNISPDLCERHLFGQAASVKTWLDDSKLLCLSAGKGVGKSMLLILKRHKFEKAYQNKDQFGVLTNTYDGVVFLPRDQYVDHNINLGYAQWGGTWRARFLGDVNNAKQLWLVALSLSIITSVDDRKHVETLVERLKLQAERNVGDFIEKLLKAYSKSISPTAVVMTLFSDAVNEGLLRSICRNAHSFTSIVSNDIRHGIILFVDATDEIDCTQDEKNVWINVQNGLYLAAWGLSKANAHIKIFTAIRQEAWANFTGPEKENASGAICELNYQSEIIPMMDHFFRMYESKTLNEIVGFKEIQSPHSGIVETPAQFIVRHTQCKPRDIVEMCRIISEEFQKENFKEFSLERRQRIFRDIANEYSGTAMISHLFSEYKYFRPHLNSTEDLNELIQYIHCNVLEKKELEEALDKYCKAKGLAKEYAHPFCDLYRIGLLGAIIYIGIDRQEAQQRFLNTFDREEYRWHEHFILPKVQFYLVHPGLGYLRRINNPEDYYPLIGVRTGKDAFVNKFAMKLIKAQKAICRYRFAEEDPIREAAVEALSVLRQVYLEKRPLNHSYKKTHIETFNRSMNVLAQDLGIASVALCQEVMDVLLNTDVAPASLLACE